MSDIYLVRDWTEVTTDGVGHVVGDSKNTVVYGDEVVKTIDKAKTEGCKISVYKLGECLLDWS